MNRRVRFSTSSRAFVCIAFVLVCLFGIYVNKTLASILSQAERGRGARASKSGAVKNI